MQNTLRKYVLKSFMSIVIIISLFMEVANIYSFVVTQKRKADYFAQILSYQSQYWETKLDIVNSYLLMLTNAKFNDTYLLMNGEKGSLELELAKQEFKQRIQQFIDINNGDFYFFYYNSRKDIYLNGTTSEYDFTEGQEIKKAVMEYFTEESEWERNKNWKIITTENGAYLVNAYDNGYGYAGAALSVALVENRIDNTLYEDAEVVVIENSEEKNPVGKSTYSQELKYSYCTIQITESGYNALKEIFSFILQICLTTVLVFLICRKIINDNLRRVISPLTELESGMKRFGDGNMDVQLKEGWEIIEVQNLYHTFNRMADRIKHLTIDIYQTELEKQKIKYSFLKIQIQPHFYSNVLNLIYGLAEIRDYESIQKLSMAMAKYFRYLLNNKTTFVEIKKELECVENYVEIQKMRYPDCISYELKCPDDLEKVQVLPIVIQTFVENSIQHNITLYPEIRITVEIRRNKELLEVLITDNGSGFEQDVLDCLKQRREISQDGKHIGILNIMERMDDTYGKDAASVELSNLSQGAQVAIKFPIESGKECTVK